MILAETSVRTLVETLARLEVPSFQEPRPSDLKIPEVPGLSGQLPDRLPVSFCH